YPVGNITVGRGTVRFWFRPDWSSGSAASPQGEAPFIELGNKDSNGWWTVVLKPNCTNLAFQTQQGGGPGTVLTNVTTPIQWASNQWHQVVVAYSASSTALYIDGQPANTNGAGIPVIL